MAATRTLDERVAAFAAAAREASAAVVEARGPADAASLVLEASPDGAVATTPALADAPVGQALSAAGATLRVAGPGTSPAALADTPVGVVAGQMAVAETGSVLVDEHPLGDRLVSMLSRHLLLVVERAAVADSLDDVAAWLAARGAAAGFAALMTGPSRSADIERSLAVGVQGPDRVTVVVVG